MTEYSMVIVAIVFVAALVAVAYFSLSRRSSSGPSGGSSPDGPLRVLILTAAVGGGHEAAGRSVRAELEGDGHAVSAKDGLRTMSRALSWSFVRFYVNQVRKTPRSLGAVFAVTSRRWGAAAVRAAVSLCFAHRLHEVIRKERPDLVVSTYPLVTAALGRRRRSGKLKIPVAAIIADYGAHPLWVDPGVDLHLVVSRPSAELVERAGGKASIARLPVAPGFRSAPAREEARGLLGLPREDFVVLIVGGAWGIGDLGGAARLAVESGAYTIVVTGNNAELKERLDKELGFRENVRVLGWREDLPILMAASDCLIQNAGGMTCLEALETGLPILVFSPISGHGVLNARVMEQAGVARLVRAPEDLGALLQSLARRETFLAAPEGEPGTPTASAVLESLAGSAPLPAARPRVGRRRSRLALAGAAAVVFSYGLAFYTPGIALAAKGLSIDVPGYDPSPGRISLGVRVADPETAAAVEDLLVEEGLPVTIFSDTRGAEGLYPAEKLTFGVAEESEGFSSPLRDRTEARAAAVEIQNATGEYPRYFLPFPKANLAAMVDAPPSTRLVMPEETGKAGPRPGLLVVETSGLGSAAARLELERTLHDIRRERLICVSPAEL